MRSTFSLSVQEIKKNIEIFVEFLKKHHLDGFYVSSTDRFLNEYVPQENCHRYYLTGFTGSTANVLITDQGKVHLFVDGRYHEQADKEVDPTLVIVEKCPMTMSPNTALIEKIRELALRTVGVEGERTSKAFEEEIGKVATVQPYDHEELGSLISFRKLPSPGEIFPIPLSIAGETVKQKLERILVPGEAILVTALDSLAWLSNARGFHLPHQSPFLGVGLALNNILHLFVDPGTPIHHDLKNDSSLKFHFVTVSQMKEAIEDIKRTYIIDKVYYHPGQLSGAQYRLLKSVFGEDILAEKKFGITEFHAFKNEAEVRHMKEAFLKASKVVHETISFIKNELKSGKKVSELDLYNKTNTTYLKSGAIDQSFNTIAATGANSSIIHYSASDEKNIIGDSELVLLDCGGLYEGGYSTDKTRTFLSKGQANQKQKEIYTLALKGLLNAQNAIFPEGIQGIAVDVLARQPILLRGYDYGHGTGHGIGINVHEGCAGFSMRATFAIRPGMTITIEPGIYLAGFGGVRLENVVHVKKHPTYPNMICFEPMVFIGFDHELIDYNMLNADELRWLEEYEKACSERGTSFKK